MIRCNLFFGPHFPVTSSTICCFLFTSHTFNFDFVNVISLSDFIRRAVAIFGFDLHGGAALRPQPAKDCFDEWQFACAASSCADFMSCVAAGLFKPRLSLSQRPFDRFPFLFVQLQFVPTLAFRRGAISALVQFALRFEMDFSRVFDGDHGRSPFDWQRVSSVIDRGGGDGASC